uniref:Uncharacterized protein n=1 Tax=Podoviridae sp. ctlpi2 TaxID=2826574 RepID=A0A8S5ML79_9CAUD|nr:MAG TPA: hypothetical protein [Podoviridae sp. ctlpi2]
MLAWESYEFAGVVPRLRKKQLPKGYATVAHDVDLTHGSLKAFQEPKFLKNALSGAVRLYAWGCDLLTWDKCVDVAEWLPDCPRLFITGNADYPQTITKEGNNFVYRRLGVPAPLPAPVAHATVVESDKSRATAYIITFVNNFGEEGGLSPPSNDVVTEDGQEVRLTFRYNPPVEYDVEKLRIYRRETGFRTGLEKEQEFDTHWFFLAELDINEREFVDTTKMMHLGAALDNLDTREPPARLANITAIPDTAILAGSVANKLLFSRNLQPHNWELSQEMTLDDNVVALGAVGNSLYVATDGHPYRVQGDVGCDRRECRDIYRYKQAFPMINCHVGQGAVATPFGFIYASPDGLVMLTDSHSPQVITSEVLSADDWRLLAPHTARLAYYKGALFVVTDKVSFILWLDGNTYADSKYKKMTTISDEPIDMAVTRQGELLLLQKDYTIAQWNAGDRLRPYRWVSAAIDTGFLFDITRVRALLRSGDATVRTVSERAAIARRFPTGDRIIPFGRHGLVKEFFIEAEGTGEITEIVAGVCSIDMGTKT